MKLIDSDVTIIPYEDPYKLVETVGRTCYKSESNITDESSKKFVENLIKNKHFAMLEHARITFKIKQDTSDNHCSYNHVLNYCKLCAEFQQVPKAYVYDGSDYIILSVTMSHLYNPKWEHFTCAKILAFLRQIFTYRDTISGYSSCEILLGAISIEILNNDDIDDVTCGPCWRDMKTMTARFICDRGVSHELVRHRVALAQESQRYCNYGLEKFGKEITYIKPSRYDEWTVGMKQAFEYALTTAEHAYFNLINLGLKPQEARGVLPNETKTEVVFTATYTEWDHFFAVRAFGVTGAPHPDMHALATKLLSSLHEDSLSDYEFRKE